MTVAELLTLLRTYDTSLQVVVAPDRTDLSATEALDLVAFSDKTSPASDVVVLSYTVTP
jgi:hypothetical protein